MFIKSLSLFLLLTGLVFSKTKKTPVLSVYDSKNKESIDYRVYFNTNGAKLVSPYKAVIYVGKDCDILSDEFGKGVLEINNGGSYLRFKDRTLGFPHWNEWFITGVTKGKSCSR